MSRVFTLCVVGLLASVLGSTVAQKALAGEKVDLVWAGKKHEGEGVSGDKPTKLTLSADNVRTWDGMRVVNYRETNQGGFEFQCVGNGKKYLVRGNYIGNDIKKLRLEYDVFQAGRFLYHAATGELELSPPPEGTSLPPELMTRIRLRPPSPHR